MQLRTLMASILLLVSFSVNGQDFSYDQKIGEEGAQQVEQMMGIYPDSALNAYINEIGQRLAVGLGNIPFEFQFRVVDMPEPNAFALPGGYVYVSRVLLSLINEEDELAGVIGHEMVHVTKRHAVKQMKQGIIPGLLKIPGALIGGLVNENLGKIINTPIDLGGSLFLSSYSRKQESESDELGIKLAAQAGYDPIKLGGVLKSLAADMENETGEEERKSYFASHPYTPKRVENIDEEAPLLVWEAKAPIESKNGLYSILNGMVVGVNPAQGVFDGDLFLHADLDIAIEFPKDWETINVPVAIAAAQPDGSAQIYIGADNPNNNPDTLGEKFAKALIEEYKVQPTQNKSIIVNGFHGHIVSFKDLSGKAPVDVQFYWIKTNQVMLNIMGMGYTSYSQALESTAKSVRSMTDEEKGSISAVRVRLEEARDEETLQSLSERSGNFWDLETTALMNGLDKDIQLKSGTLVKIAKKESYP